MIKIRLQKVSDAKRFYEILSNPNFIYFSAKPKSVEDEKKFLRDNPKRRKNNTAWNYTILFEGNKRMNDIGCRSCDIKYY